jgi:hypothetical protein
MLLLKIMRIVHLAGYTTTSLSWRTRTHSGNYAVTEDYENCTLSRLYHHLAILVRPNALWQLDYYSRSLTLYSWQAVPPPRHSYASERHPTTILLFKVVDFCNSISSVLSRYNGETLITLLVGLQTP